MGRGYGGEAITTVTGVRANIEGNIIQFSDNNAIRFNADVKDVRITDNVFAQNLWAILYRTENIVDDATFGQLGDFGLAASSGNRLLNPAIPLDAKWFDVYLSRTAYTAGKVKMDDWNQLREVLGQPLIATGGSAGRGRAPAYDLQKTLSMVPKHPECMAGARPFRATATFTGIVREEVSHDYAEASWSTAKSRDAWDALDGKRVALKVAIQRTDNQWKLDDVKKEEYECFTVIGPEGSDGGGLPMHCYVKRGTTAERAMQNAKRCERGTPEQVYVLSGVARGNRTFVVEAVANAD